MCANCTAGCSEIGEDGELALYNPRTGVRKLFKYDRVFGSDSTQEQVYEDTKPLIRSVLDGAHALKITKAQLSFLMNTLLIDTRWRVSLRA